MENVLSEFLYTWNDIVNHTICDYRFFIIILKLALSVVLEPVDYRRQADLLFYSLLLLIFSNRSIFWMKI